MIRSILVVLFIVAFLIISLPLDLILYIISCFNPDLRISLCRKVMQPVFKGILGICGARITVDGQENIPEGAVLFVGNHQSYFDILTAYINIPGGVGFISKKEMNKIPLINLWMKGMNCLFLDRENIREGVKTIKKGVEELKKGYSMFIYPEGTRNQAPELLPFKEGSTKLAERSGAPIVPVAVSGTADLFENNKFLRITPADVKITFGKPIVISELTREEKKFLGAHCRKVIEEMLENHKR